MKIEERFNVKTAKLVEVQPPSVSFGHHLGPDVKLQFFPICYSDDRRNLHMHLSPSEALQLAADLIRAADWHMRNPK